MAKETRNDKGVTLIFTRKEAVDIVGLLTAQLADSVLVGNQGGACPTIRTQTSAWTFIYNDQNKNTKSSFWFFDHGEFVVPLTKDKVVILVWALISQITGDCSIDNSIYLESDTATAPGFTLYIEVEH